MVNDEKSEEAGENNSEKEGENSESEEERLGFARRRLSPQEKKYSLNELIGSYAFFRISGQPIYAGRIVEIGEHHYFINPFLSSDYEDEENPRKLIESENPMLIPLGAIPEPTTKENIESLVKRLNKESQQHKKLMDGAGKPRKRRHKKKKR